MGAFWWKFVKPVFCWEALVGRRDFLEKNGCAVESVTGQKIVVHRAVEKSLSVQWLVHCWTQCAVAELLNRQHSYLYSINLWPPSCLPSLPKPLFSRYSQLAHNDQIFSQNKYLRYLSLFAPFYRFCEAYKSGGCIEIDNKTTDTRESPWLSNLLIFIHGHKQSIYVQGGDLSST